MLHMKAKASQLAREHNERAWLAYTTAALTRAKRMPPLRDLLVRDGDRKPRSWHDMKSVAMQWTVALGGQIKTKDS